MAEESKAVIAERISALANALRLILVAEGVIWRDAYPDGPDLLLAADTYLKSRGLKDGIDTI